MQAWHRKARDRLIYFGYCYSILIGTVTFIVDYERRRIVTRKFYKYYAHISNIIIAVTLPFMLLKIISFGSQFEQNTLIKWTDRILAGVRLIVVLLILVLRTKRERRFIAIAKQLFELDSRFFDKHKQHARLERRLTLLYFVKFFTTSMHTLISFIIALQIIKEISVQALFVILYACNMQNIIHGLLLQYFGALINIWRRFALLNFELKRVYRCLSRTHARALLHRHVSQTLLQLSLVAAADLREIARVHNRLTQITHLLTDSFNYMAIGVLLNYMLQYIIFAYYSVIFTDESQVDPPMSKWTIAIGTVLYCFLVLDLYLFYWTCELVSYAYQNTSELLGRFCDLPHLPVDLELQCELFLLQLVHHKLPIRVANIFNLNRASVLMLCAYILKSTLILVQFEYEQRLKLLKQQISLDWTQSVIDIIDND